MASEETNTETAAATDASTDNNTEQAASAEDASAAQSNQQTTTTTENNDPNKDLNLPEDPTLTTVQQQRILMKRCGEKMQIEGDEWYPIDKKWYDSWKAYVMWTKADDDIPGGLEGLDNSGIPRPGKIDNSDLQDQSNPAALRQDIQENRTHVWVHQDVWKLLLSWYGGGPAFPRKVYERGTTYAKEKYICIYPQLVKLVYCDDTTGKIDVEDESKIVLKQFPPDYTLKQMAKDLEDEMDVKKDDSKEDTPYVHVWLKFGQVKVIYTIEKKVKVTEEDLADVDPERWVEIPDDYLKTKLDDIALNQEQSAADAPPTADGDSAAAATTDDANATAPDVAATDAADSKQPEEETKAAEPAGPPKEFLIAIEKKREDGTWPRAKGDDWKETVAVGDILDVRDEQEKWYETVIRLVGKPDSDHAGKFIVHYIGWNIKWDEWVEIESERVCKRHTHTKGPHRPRKQTNYGGGGGYYDSSFSFWQNENGPPEQRGVVGLRNLGNTCFMNSTIQCLAQSPQLTKYFLEGDYKHHINTNNPLGWGGRVAKAWAHLLQEMFSGQYRVVAPRQFKSAIGEVAPRFMGYAQQDSQELLSFLLDGLHEDLNQIQQKPATDSVESAGRPDKVVAMEAWKTYLKRNQSVIVDLLQGQYKSKVVCPDCHRVSITFDPYMFLSVPLPTERHKIVEYTWIDADTSKPPTVCGQKMLKVADIQMLKEAIAKKQGVPKEELFVCDIWKSKIHRELRRHDSVSDINRKSDDIFVYHSPRPNMDEWKQADVDKAEDAGDKDPVAEDAEKPPAGAEPAGGAGDEEDERDAGGGPPADPEVNGAGGNYYGGGRYNYGRQQQKKAKPEYQTFVVNNQHRVQARQQYMNAQQRWEDEPIGYPLLVTLPMKLPVTKAQIRNALWKLIQPFLRDENLTLEDELPFEFWAAWGFENHQKIDDAQTVFDLGQRNLKFLVHWKDVNQYKSELYNMAQRERDESAPPPLDPNHVSSIGFDDDDRRGRGKPIDLTTCIEAFCEKETLSENDAWYCSKCKDFKCASKKIDLWNAPDLLIIHLKRFSYTRNWRDRINTLVRFPIEGLDLSNYLLDDDATPDDATYDLYAVSNHMGGMGGGHYTAYAKNLDNKQWYHLDDSRTSKVNNPESVVSSAAYVLYYYKRNPRKMKHRASRIDIAALEKSIQEQEEQTPQ